MAGEGGSGRSIDTIARHRSDADVRRVLVYGALDRPTLIKSNGPRVSRELSIESIFEDWLIHHARAERRGGLAGLGELQQHAPVAIQKRHRGDRVDVVLHRLEAIYSLENAQNLVVYVAGTGKVVWRRVPLKERY